MICSFLLTRISFCCVVASHVWLWTTDRWFLLTTTPSAAPTGTKSYILRSLLDPALIEQACSPDAEIRELEQKEHVDENEEFAEDDNPIGQRSTGSIFAWHDSDQLASTGMLYVVLALILVEGRVISDSMYILSSRLQGSR